MPIIYIYIYIYIVSQTVPIMVLTHSIGEKRLTNSARGITLEISIVIVSNYPLFFQNNCLQAGGVSKDMRAHTV